MKAINSMRRAIQAAAPKAPKAPKGSKEATQLAKNVASDLLAKAKSTAKAVSPRVDSFHHGVQVRMLGAEVHVTPFAAGASVQPGTDSFGVSFRVVDGPATLGAMAVKLGQVEVSVGIVPAAPAPTPMPVYVGKPRDE